MRHKLIHCRVNKNNFTFSSGFIAFIQIAILAFFLFITYTFYQNGVGAGKQFDDEQNLTGLLSVNDTLSTLVYLTDGHAGPLGRPVSLLTFLLQKSSWPDYISELLHTNILIHIINSLLLCLLIIYIFQGTHDYRQRTTIWIAILVSATWALHPINSSAILMLIQRMTLLSSTFVLLGLILYVKGRMLLGRKPKKSYALMCGGIILCSILAALSKETGALLPFFALSLEATILQPPDTTRKQQKLFNAWKYFIFITPTIFLTLYFIVTWNDIVASYANRTFDFSERLATESVILWEYIQQIIAPNISSISPYHDDQPVRNWGAIPVFSAMAWLALIVLAIKQRRELPLLSLGILWYLFGHLLESTIFPLELYFEHRNYIPSIGIIFILTAVFLTFYKNHKKIISLFIGLYICILVGLLHQITTLWGNPLLSANVWHQYHPYSERAAQNYSQKLALNNEIDKANRVINEASERMPKNSGLALQSLQLNCYKEMSESSINKYHSVLEQSQYMSYSGAALDAFQNLITIEQKDNCTYLEIEDIQKLGNILLGNPHFLKQKLAIRNLHIELSRIFLQKKDLNASMQHLESAYKIQPSLGVLSSMFTALVSAGLYNDALKIVQSARTQRPRNIFKTQQWDMSLDNLENFLIKKIQDTDKRPEQSM